MPLVELTNLQGPAALHVHRRPLLLQPAGRPVGAGEPDGEWLAGWLADWIAGWRLNGLLCRNQERLLPTSGGTMHVLLLIWQPTDQPINQVQHAPPPAGLLLVVPCSARGPGAQLGGAHQWASSPAACNMRSTPRSSSTADLDMHARFAIQHLWLHDCTLTGSHNPQLRRPFSCPADFNYSLLDWSGTARWAASVYYGERRCTAS